MISVMAIRGEVFGSCVEEIGVSIELKNGDAWLCCGLKYLGFILSVKSSSRLAVWWTIVPCIGGHFGVDLG